MAILYAIDGFSVNSSQFGKARLAEIVFGSQGEQAVGQFGAHVLNIAFEGSFAWLRNRL
jgi:hypothetical protein